MCAHYEVGPEGNFFSKSMTRVSPWTIAGSDSVYPSGADRSVDRHTTLIEIASQDRLRDELQRT